MSDPFPLILASEPADVRGTRLGTSREGRSVEGYRLGRGPRAVSLIAGCHADEPVGPRLLAKLVSYLATLPAGDPLIADWDWWIIPHLNPDGAHRNRAWQVPAPSGGYSPGRYLRHVVRELPGDDVEFGFPRDDDDHGARPENRAAYDWWRSAGVRWRLHLSLHGMGLAGGAWFLIDRAWRDLTADLRARLRDKARELGYPLHDVERHGEKGFVRIERGFATRPSSSAMRAHFEGLGDAHTADLFRPSSMETLRRLGGDVLTLVSELPLFIAPEVGRELGPPDPEATRWREHLQAWRQRLLREEPEQAIDREADELELIAMPVEDQMRLQWELIASGLECVRYSSSDG